ncbi:4Fe-4S binding protein [Candidatus Bathyarchaeota archaeon]|nr:4Fe-4S binding protein [Candidatus Bathyarchaeota archaeon]MCK4482516.1 4Fe-4S binding protein [Candidatus Bathyarchaeota archaeon]
MAGKIAINKELCKGCALCISACPQKLIVVAEEINSKGYYPAEFVDPKEACTGCTLCALICPEVAIEVFSKEKT